MNIRDFIANNGTIHCDTEAEALALLDLLEESGFTIGFNREEWVIKYGSRFFALSNGKIHTGKRKFNAGEQREYCSFDEYKDPDAPLPEINELPPLDLLFACNVIA